MPAIVEADRATANYTFAHEVGHLQGGRHQQCYIYNPGGCDNSSDYGHGYGWTSTSGYRHTIMHQSHPTGTRIQHFSNPDVSFGGDVTGVANTNDVERKIRSTASRIAGYRISFLQAYISGPTAGCEGPYTWQAEVSGGATPYSYLWEQSTDGFNYDEVGWSGSYTATIPPWADPFLSAAYRLLQ